jgi:hypothetical protein
LLFLAIIKARFFIIAFLNNRVVLFVHLELGSPFLLLMLINDLPSFKVIVKLCIATFFLIFM